MARPRARGLFLPPLLAERAGLSLGRGGGRGRDILTILFFSANARMTVDVHESSKVGSGSSASKWLSVLAA